MFLCLDVYMFRVTILVLHYHHVDSGKRAVATRFCQIPNLDGSLKKAEINGLVISTTTIFTYLLSSEGLSVRQHVDAFVGPSVCQSSFCQKQIKSLF